MIIDRRLKGKRCSHLLVDKCLGNSALWRGQGHSANNISSTGSLAVWAGASQKVTPLKRSG